MTSRRGILKIILPHCNRPQNLMSRPKWSLESNLEIMFSYLIEIFRVVAPY